MGYPEPGKEALELLSTKEKAINEFCETIINKSKNQTHSNADKQHQGCQIDNLSSR